MLKIVPAVTAPSRGRRHIRASAANGEASRRWAHSGLNSQFAAVAAKEALTAAGLIGDSKVDRTRVGVYLGSGEGVQDFHSTVWLTAQSYRTDTRSVDAAAFMKGASSQALTDGKRTASHTDRR